MSEFTLHEAREALLGEAIPWDPAVDRKLRKAIGLIPAGRPKLQDAITEIARLHPALRMAAEGVYCGESGRYSQKVETGNPRIHRSLTVGWHLGVVEFAYLA